MEIIQLRSFLKVAELGSFTRAARECYLSQPAISQQISKLESELGCLLFERKTRHVELTEAGERLAERARQIVALVDDTARQVQDDGQTGKVVVGAIPTIAPYFLPEILSRFRRAFPAAHIEVNELVTEALVRRCEQGEIDVGILALPADVRTLAVQPLFDEPLWLVMPPEHPLASQKSVRIDLVRTQPFVILDEAHCLSSQMRGFCEGRHFQPITTGKTSQLATVQEMVALGHGLSLIPDMARRLDTSNRRVYRPIAGDPPRRTIAACWNAARYLSKLSKAFLDVLRQPIKR